MNLQVVDMLRPSRNSAGGGGAGLSAGAFLELWTQNPTTKAWLMLLGSLGVRR